MAIKTILVPTDFSESAGHACRVAAELAKAVDASVHLLHVLHLPVQAVTPEIPVVPVGYWRDIVAHAEGTLAAEKAKLEKLGLRVTSEVFEDLPGFAISAAAKRAQADLIVMGSRGLTGVKHAVFGSVAERTVRTAHCPVLTVKAEGGALQLRNILVAMDFSASAKKALELAQDLAKRAGPAHVILLHAYYIPVELEQFLVERGEPALEKLSKSVTQELESMLAKLKQAGISAEYIASRGAPESLVVELAKQRNVDLIAMGTHGRRGLSHLLLGSVAERVVRTAECPVLTARE